jgi:hypothetical protein
MYLHRASPSGDFADRIGRACVCPITANLNANDVEHAVGGFAIVRGCRHRWKRSTATLATFEHKQGACDERRALLGRDCTPQVHIAGRRLFPEIAARPMIRHRRRHSGMKCGSRLARCKLRLFVLRGGFILTPCGTFICFLPDD